MAEEKSKATENTEEKQVMIKADNLVKIYKTKETEVLALQGLDLTVDAGELTAIIGNSGSGKSTFLNMIGGLDRPSAGSLFVAGSNLFTMTEKELFNYLRGEYLLGRSLSGIMQGLSAIQVESY